MVGCDDFSRALVPAIADVPLKLLANRERITYSSAIAHQWAAQRPVLPLAAAIAAAWRDRRHQPDFWQRLCLPADALPDLQIEATSAGFIQIQIPDPAIAVWLSSLISGSAPPACPSAATAISYAADAFPLLHAHARCCSLLRLAHCQGLIQLNDPDRDPQLWQVLRPNPIIWLNSDQALIVNLPVDRTLIAHLFTANDAMQRLAPLTSVTALRLATAIAQAFQHFHRAHPLFSQPSSQGLPAQCGLLLATQRLLRRLLTECLQTAAPIAI